MYRVGDKVKAVVKSFDGKNYIVKIEEENAFVYYNNIHLQIIKEPEKIIGQEFEFLVKEIFPNDPQKKFELTRIPLMLAELENNLDKVKVGSEVEITDFEQNNGGIEFDYEGFKVFVPYKLISHAYVSSDEDLSYLKGKRALITECEKVKFGYNVVASIKALEEDPFDSYVTTLNEGDTVTGKIIVKEHYGMFLRLSPSVKALLHKNDYSDELIDDVESVQVEDNLEVKIKMINKDKKQIDVTMLD